MSKLWRNREIRILLLIMVVISVIATIGAYFYVTAAAFFTMLTALLLITCTLLFTAWRYREIAKLSSYIRKISSGDYSLDLRDNREGELSVLKNDIYKVTLKLAEQSSLLQQDKVQLTNAIADISHQLKTPLTSMMVMTDLLKDAKLDEEKRTEFTNSISRQLERIEWLISSLLKVSKIDAGTVRFKQEVISVISLVKKALEPVLIPMDIKEHTLTIEGEETVTCRCDLNWTAEALTNILKNCVEHTPQGGRIVIAFQENPLYTEIRIRDDGSGIAKEDLPNIFKRFYKGKNSSDDSVGIGLNLSYSIITAQMGDIEVKSKEGEGTDFIVKFYKHII
ncbi:HAMP domain-containing sensor histidine kinase [Acetivibrio clariflavus]